MIQPREKKCSAWLCSKKLGLAALLLLTATLAYPQVSQLSFDARGNLSQADEVSALPVILCQPQSRLALTGEFASFIVVAADTRQLTYQWRFNGTNLLNATNDALLVTNVTVAKDGSYSVVLVNGSGSVTSAPAALMIDADSDCDGLANSWEMIYFGNLNQNASGDSDGDGVSNGDEFRDGTNPTNSASAFFRLTISSDGGEVTLSPSKLKYTNGEAVTVTATPYGSEKFRGWTGDVLSTNNSLVLTMTSNRFLAAHFSYYTITWANTVGGDWHTAGNWSPNLVPAMGDTVVLGINASVTANNSAECGSRPRHRRTLRAPPDPPCSTAGPAVRSRPESAHR